MIISKIVDEINLTDVDLKCCWICLFTQTAPDSEKMNEKIKSSVEIHEGHIDAVNPLIPASS